MSQFVEIFQDLVVRRLQQVYGFTIEVGPKILLAIIILLIGWISALLLKKIAGKLLKALGFDVLSEKIGVVRILNRGGVERKPSSVVGLGFYWLIMFSALLMAFNALELAAASQLTRQGILYIPKIIVTIVLIALGIFLSQFIGKFVRTSARLANIPFYEALGVVSQYLIIGLSVMVTLDYLGVATTAVIIFAVIPVIVSLIFLIGGREIISDVLAARIIAKEYKKGDLIELDTIKGEIKSFDLMNTTIADSEADILIPNSKLVKSVVKKIKAGGK